MIDLYAKPIFYEDDNELFKQFEIRPRRSRLQTFRRAKGDLTVHTWYHSRKDGEKNYEDMGPFIVCDHSSRRFQTLAYKIFYINNDPENTTLDTIFVFQILVKIVFDDDNLRDLIATLPNYVNLFYGSTIKEIPAFADELERCAQMTRLIDYMPFVN